MKAPWSILVVVVAVAVAGCSFELPSPEDDAGADPGDPATADRCTDPDLRLCLDFEDPTPIADRSASGLTTTMLGEVTFAERADEQAAALAPGAALRVTGPRTDPLDLSEFTLELWLRLESTPTGGDRYAIFDHGDRHFLDLSSDLRLACGIGGDRTVTSGDDGSARTIANDGLWHHVACTYDRRELRVFIDGRLAGCRGENTEITPAKGETFIGARSAGPSTGDHFHGQLDNIHVLARAAAPAEICQLAGNPADCPTSCPDD